MIDLPDCSCKDLISRQGIGNCLQPAAGGPYKGKNICYVKQPTACTDVQISSLKGEDYSALACVLKGFSSYIHTLTYI